MKLAAGNPVSPGCLAAFFLSLAFAAPCSATVLRLIGPGSEPIRAAKAVCGIPFIEMPKTEVEFYRNRATSAVLRMRDPSLTGQRMACLAALKPDSVTGR